MKHIYLKEPSTGKRTAFTTLTGLLKTMKITEGKTYRYINSALKLNPDGIQPDPWANIKVSKIEVVHQKRK